MTATAIEPVTIDMHENPPGREYSFVRLRDGDNTVSGWVPRVKLFAGPLRPANLSRKIMDVPPGVTINMINGNSR